ncbi:MAG: glucosamine-6-phosphate deaminase [Rhodococcus sp. (in: high G+C Gram-positive bacteria)]
MEIVIRDGTDSVHRTVADIVERRVRQGPAVLGLATGSTPLGTYRELGRRCRDHALSFASSRAFLLDEYVGLPASHPQSYRSVIRSEFLAEVDMDPRAIDGPDGDAADIAVETARYDAAIRDAGGVDVQLLGIGTDGHIGFNEPGSSLASRTRVKTLTEQTRQDNARFFSSASEVPHHVMTQGLGTIVEARHLVLIAMGESKAEALAAAVEGPLTAFCPASVLQMHAHVTVVVDDAAASALRLGDYYRYALAEKPPWQHF